MMADAAPAEVAWIGAIYGSSASLLALASASPCLLCRLDARACRDHGGPRRAPPAVLTPGGIVLIYNGANHHDGGHAGTPPFAYRPGQMLLDGGGRWLLYSGLAGSRIGVSFAD